MPVIAMPKRRRPNVDRAAEALTRLADQLDELAVNAVGAQINGDAFAEVFAELAALAREGLK
jgi:hypothetical protein